MYYIENDQVMVHSLGPSHGEKQYRGIIKGLAIDGPAKIWIVEMVDRIESDSYRYSHCTMPGACLRLGWPK